MEDNPGPGPGPKHSELNFKLCIRCQSPKKETKTELKKPPDSQKESTYEKFLAAVRLRAQFGNTEFVVLSEKIGHLTPQDLSVKHAMWHRSC